MSLSPQASAPTGRSLLLKATFLMSTLKFLNQLMLFYWGVYFTHIALSGTEQGILLALYPLIGLLAIMPIGFLNDRISSKHLIGLGFLLLALQYFTIARTEDFFPIALSMMAGSFGSIMTKMSLDSFFYKNSDHTQERQVGTYVGSYLLAAGLGALLGGLLLDTIPFERLFTAVGGLAVVMAIISLLLPGSTRFHLEWKGYREDLLQPRTMLFMCMMFLWAIHMGAEITSYGLFLQEDLGLTYPQMGFYMGTAIAGMFLWSRLGGHLLHKKVALFRILFWGLFLSGSGQFIATASWIELSYAGRCMHEMGDAFMFVFFYNGVRKIFPKERSGGSASVMNFGEMVAIILSSLLFAPLGETYGNIYPLWIGATSIFLALPIAYKLAASLRSSTL